MAEATLYKDADTIDVTTPSAGYSSGEVIQLSDGRAAVVTGLTAKVSGDPAALKTSGQFTLTKGADLVILEGAPLYWDRSAGSVTPIKVVAGGDFYAGVAVTDVAAATLTCVVDLNVKPNYTIDIMRDPTDTVIVAGGLMSMGPGYAKLSCAVATEAQKSDIMSIHSVPVVDGSAVPFIVEGRMTIFDNGNDTALDINVGIADDTHADEADTIAESVFLHFDGSSGSDLNINAESDDGTTEVASTDTTVDYAEETYFDFAFDCRDLSDIKIYINGVQVLSASTFVLTDATGPMKLLAHVEKASNDTLADVRIAKLALRCTDLAA